MNRDQLVSELAQLPAGDRAVVELVDIAGLRPKEAAAALGLAPGTVRMRLMRTRARLRRETPHLETPHLETEGLEPSRPEHDNQTRGDRND